MFAKGVGATEVLVYDSHKTQKKIEVKAFCSKIGTKLRILEGITQWDYVGLIKERVRNDKQEAQPPFILWNDCIERREVIFTVSSKNLFQLNGTNKYTTTLG